MNRIIFIVLFLMLTSNVNAQETKFVQRKFSDPPIRLSNGQIKIKKDVGYIEQYYVFKEDKKVKHGTYVKFRDGSFGIQILESGNYQRGQKSGVWEYYYESRGKFSENKLKETGIYANGRKNGVWTSYFYDTTFQNTYQKVFGSRKRPDSINVTINSKHLKIENAGIYLNDKKVGEWIFFAITGEIIQRYNYSKRELVFDSSLTDSITQHVHRKTLYIGGTDCLYDFISKEFNHEMVAMNSLTKDSSSVKIMFTVDKEGNVINPQVEESNSIPELGLEVLRVLKLTSKNWIPPLSNSMHAEEGSRIHVYVKKNKIENFTTYKMGISFQTDHRD